MVKISNINLESGFKSRHDGGITQKMLDRNPNTYYRKVPAQYERNGRRVIGCWNCKSEFTVPLWLDNKSFTCPKCKQPLPNLPIKAT